MKIYQVGGSVRDEFLGLSPHDIDYCVVGITEDDFQQCNPSAKKVGKSFPVFLLNGFEYAFARKEKKNGNKHTDFICDFSPNTTIEDDLYRRDLTINAIAKDCQTGKIIDPYGGINDLNNKIIRHVSDAFSDDPLRVYRVARFASKFHDFSIHPSTLNLMRDMKDSLQYISYDRVKNEMEKALNEKHASRFFTVLKNVGILDVHFKELSDLDNIPAGRIRHKDTDSVLYHLLEVMDKCNNTEERFLALCHDFGKLVTSKNLLPKHHGHDNAGVNVINDFCFRFNIKKSLRKKAMAMSEYHMRCHRIMEMRTSKKTQLIDNIIKQFRNDYISFFNVVKNDGAFEDEKNYIDKIIDIIPQFIECNKLGNKDIKDVNKIKQYILDKKINLIKKLN